MPRKRHSHPVTGNPAHIDYTYDQNVIRDSLRDVGVERIPAHYRPLLQLHIAGMQYITLARENDTHATTMSIDVVQDVDGKISAMIKRQVGSTIGPAGGAKSFAGKCTEQAGYKVGDVHVKRVYCKLDGNIRLRTETAAVPDGEILIIVSAQTQSDVFDEAPFKQLINEVNTDHSSRVLSN